MPFLNRNFPVAGSYRIVPPAIAGVDVLSVLFLSLTCSVVRVLNCACDVKATNTPKINIKIRFILYYFSYPAVPVCTIIGKVKFIFTTLFWSPNISYLSTIVHLDIGREGDSSSYVHVQDE